MASSITSLAEETIQIIISHLDTAADLAQCRLVCKRFNALADKAMFNCPVTIHTESQALSLLQHLARCQRKGLTHFHWGLTPPSSTTPQVLKHLLPMILTSNTVSLSGIVEGHEFYDLMIDIVDQLPEKPKLTAIPQCERLDENQLPYLAKFKDTLRSVRLDIVDPDYTDTDFILDILAFPALKSLALKIYEIDILDLVRACGGDDLEELDLEIGTLVHGSDGFIEGFLLDKEATQRWASNHTNGPNEEMKRLTLKGDCSACCLEAFMSMFPNLESVSIDMFYPDWLIVRWQWQIRMDRILDCLEHVAEKKLVITTTEGRLLRETVEYFKAKGFDVNIEAVPERTVIRMNIIGFN